MNTIPYKTDLSQTIRVHADGTVERGIEVPHEGANLQCFYPLGEERDPETGRSYRVLCRKRANHWQRKGEERHVPVDYRLSASPARVVHGRRFAPGGIPAGVDQSITLPHDCANHLRDVEDIANGLR